MKIAAIQLQSKASVQENIDNALGWVAKAASQGAQLVVLPENVAMHGLPLAAKQAIAEDFLQGPLQTAFAQAARDHHVWVVSGSLWLRSSHDTRLRSATLVWDSDGQCVGRYDKIHLFDVAVSDSETYQESAVIAPGDKTVVIKTPVGNVGLSICYDLRFPELYRMLRKKGADIVVVPSAFTYTTGKAHWEVLLRARAIENQMYMVAANQEGEALDGRKTFGHSMIVDPWGDILGVQPTGEGIVLAERDPTRQSTLRKNFPITIRIDDGFY